MLEIEHLRVKVDEGDFQSLRAAFVKRELCKAPVVGMYTEKGIYYINTYASVVANSGILHQEQEWNGRTALCPIANGKKILSDNEMKFDAPKAELFAVVTSLGKYHE